MHLKKGPGQPQPYRASHELNRTALRFYTIQSKSHIITLKRLFEFKKTNLVVYPPVRFLFPIVIVAQYIFPLDGRSIIAVAIVAAMPLAPNGQRAVTTVVLLCYLKLMLGVMAEIVGQEEHRQRVEQEAARQRRRAELREQLLSGRNEAINQS